MTYEQVWAVVTFLTVLAGVALAIWARHLREAKKVALREMIHQERMTALEKGVTLPELAPDVPAGLGEAAGGTAWVHSAALLAGLVLLVGGTGTMAAFLLIGPGTGVSDLGLLWPVGLIPASAGIGLLLYYALDRLLGPSRGR
jgi:hypothetical protein